VAFFRHLPHINSMDILSVFGIRGRPKEVHQLEDTLLARGLQPGRVADSVKLAAVKLMKEAEGGAMVDAEVSCARAASLLVYCMLGSYDFTTRNGLAETAAAEARLRHAIESGESLDAHLIMLTLLARVIHPDVVGKFDLEIE
jgi:hypothetical protein